MEESAEKKVADVAKALRIAANNERLSAKDRREDAADSIRAAEKLEASAQSSEDAAAQIESLLNPPDHHDSREN